MEKYYITNGRSYIQKRNNSIVLTTRLKATEFGLQNAVKTLKNKLSTTQHHVYYFEDVETGNILRLADLEKEREEKESSQIVNDILSLEEDINHLQEIIKRIPNKVTCASYYDKLCQMLQDEDKRLSDCNHWVRDHKRLSLDVAYKVYEKYQTHNIKRYEIKKAQNYLKGLSEFYDKNESFVQLVNLLEEMKYDSAYKPRTDTYSELDELLAQSKNKRKKKVEA